MKDNNFPKLNLSNLLKDDSYKLKLGLPDTSINPNYQEIMDRFHAESEKKKQIELDKETARIAREEKQIELLEEIKSNTGSLVNMVDMIRFNSDQQTEILSIIAEIMVLGTFDDKTEAESSFRKIMNNINQKIEDTESMIKLSDLATTTWGYVKVKYFGG